MADLSGEEDPVSPASCSIDVQPPRVFLESTQRLRDEFACPITCELMHDPVVAADGHTYDREAISRWLSTHSTSPRTSEPLSHLGLVPNHNLKRLIVDLVQEGGAALYTSPVNPSIWPPDEEKGLATMDIDRELVREAVLILKRKDPPQPPHTNQTYRVPKRGADAGRSRSGGKTSYDSSRLFIPIDDDASISRRHLSINFNDDLGRFEIQDMGSSSGTLIRLRNGERCELVPDCTFGVGKHQFQVIPSVVPDSKLALSLQCVAPDTSPLHGSRFLITQDITIIGRSKQGSRSGRVSLCTQVDGDLVCVDRAVSNEHARILREPDASRPSQLRFVLVDGGAENRPSMNGTWLRLSPSHEFSPPYPLLHGTEILVGCSNFEVLVESTIAEQSIAKSSVV